MLSADELRTLDAALDRIVPPDRDPGAIAAGVGDYARGRAAVMTGLYRAGIILLQARGFADLSPDAQDAVLLELEGHPSIALIVQHAIEGYYTSEAGLLTVGFRVTA
jgi:hypothetical protein